LNKNSDKNAYAAVTAPQKEIVVKGKKNEMGDTELEQ
jgi:hypothetical protein